MNLSFSDLENLYDLVRNEYDETLNGGGATSSITIVRNDIRKELSDLHLLMHKLLELQKEGWEKCSRFPVEPAETVNRNFAFSTAETAKKLKVTDSDLRALRNAKELKEGYHYTTGRSPRPTAIWYDIHQTCIQVHGITWTAFNSPGFDLKAHTERRTAQAFDAARRSQKK